MLCTISGTVVSTNSKILTVSATPRPRYDQVPEDGKIVYTEKITVATKRDGTWSMDLVQGETYSFRIGAMMFSAQVPFADAMDFTKLVSPVPFQVGMCPVLEFFDKTMLQGSEQQIVRYSGNIIKVEIDCCEDSLELALRSEYTDGRAYLPLDLSLHISVVADNTSTVINKCHFEVLRPPDDSDTTVYIEELDPLAPQNIEYWFVLEGTTLKFTSVNKYTQLIIHWR